ncbi:hypothetical protein CLAFUW4_20013 [Fulvia fulva]|uniref:uncharacterized protein n=1 Tax=Passalora fulva TaxID=5499 RepID=UPI002852BF25|nr:uncharacterized protein CLAFUR5_20013 [Fulvia fulva]KAK4635167.1 hypothetical protein CLAFUR4_20013 [Fulvia fulva]KAK4638409.1 hypothetical protein CLAFUR0_20013 [Fulvia fulva]WMI38773.1 hypothetical protein CLAFUR5_20013 [Fulvia fulva]WPV09641.1 hypothetical protein CLAFUW4_20013 [Fulvia fulva]WPV23967.1 hypothetical protein CLAFUW7_20013 [Fulvia fulva]
MSFINVFAAATLLGISLTYAEQQPLLPSFGHNKLVDTEQLQSYIKGETIRSGLPILLLPMLGRSMDPRSERSSRLLGSGSMKRLSSTMVGSCSSRCRSTGLDFEQPREALAVRRTKSPEP